jgi:hypothetical protein
MNKSETIGELAAALAIAQGEMEAATKDTKNTFFNSKYADLASVWDACRKPLAKNGLSVVQLIEPPPVFEGLYHTRAIVETILTHKSGEWISSVTSLPVFGRELKGGGRGEVDAQSFGSAITYARRYALAAIVGVYQDDDDGNAASDHAKPEGMPESKLADHLAAIDTAADLEALKKTYTVATRDALRDQAALTKIIAKKDARKAALDELAKAEASAKGGRTQKSDAA